MLCIAFCVLVLLLQDAAVAQDVNESVKLDERSWIDSFLHILSLSHSILSVLGRVQWVGKR